MLFIEQLRADLDVTITKIRGGANIEAFLQPRPATPTSPTAIDKSVKVVNPALGVGTEDGGDPIVIRSVYEKMWDAFMLTRKLQLQYPKRSFRMVFVGPPGIGKTVWLTYAIVRCVKEGIPFVVTWDWDMIYHYDGTDSAREINSADIRKLNSSVCVLADSGPSWSPKSEIQGANRLVALTTSPLRDRWSWAEKNTVLCLMYIPQPSLSEIEQMSVTGDPHAGVRPNLIEVFGRCPRRLGTGDTWDEAVEKIRRAAKFLVVDPVSLVTAIAGDAIADKDQAKSFHQIFVDVLMNAAESDWLATRFPFPVDITLSEKAIARQLKNAYSVRHQIATRLQAEVLREALQEASSRRGNLFLSEFNKLEDRSLYAIAFEGQVLETIASGKLTIPYIMNGAERHLPSTLRRFPDRLPTHGPLPTSRSMIDNNLNYFVQVAPRFPTADAIIITPSEIILLQLTISGRHTASEVGWRRVHEWLVGKRKGNFNRKWSLVYVVPDDVNGGKLTGAKHVVEMATAVEKALGIGKISTAFLTVPEIDHFDAPCLETQVNDFLSFPDAKFDTDAAALHESLPSANFPPATLSDEIPMEL